MKNAPEELTQFEKKGSNLAIKIIEEVVKIHLKLTIKIQKQHQ